MTSKSFRESHSSLSASSSDAPKEKKPDNIPLHPLILQIVEEQHVLKLLFTGGLNSLTQSHMLNKVIESEVNHPQITGAKVSFCAIHGCDSKLMSDERGKDIIQCECEFKICRDCFMDAAKSEGKICPGCKEAYNTCTPPLTPRNGKPKMKSTKSGLMRSQNFEFDDTRLFETKGTYGYGNAIQPTKEGLKEKDVVEPNELIKRPWRPLTRKMKIAAAVRSPYRYEAFNL